MASAVLLQLPAHLFFSDLQRKSKKWREKITCLDDQRDEKWWRESKNSYPKGLLVLPGMDGDSQEGPLSRMALAKAREFDPSELPWLLQTFLLLLLLQPVSLSLPRSPMILRIGYVRSVRAYGIEFKEGPDGFGVYASKDIEATRRARVIMEVPLELMLTISKEFPWMFFPDIIPIGHPIFDIINSTNPETDWDLRLACLLLFALDLQGNFWQLYGDFLPSADECTSLLLATEEDLLELQDHKLASTMREQQRRALEFWQKNWHSAVPLKIMRLALEPERFLWAVGMAQSRCINFKPRIGALIKDRNMLIPYADMLNHSFQPNCFFHWRFKDRMLEVMINAGQRVGKGEELTVNYMSSQKNDMFMQRHGFSSPVNPWEVIQFSGNAKIHLDSFLSVFNISGLPWEYYHNSQLGSDAEGFIDGAVLAAARTLPTWSDGAVPPIPSAERKAVKELQEECRQRLTEFPTTAEQDMHILDSMPEARRTLEAAIKYRLHRKSFIEKVIRALDIYRDRILF